MPSVPDDAAWKAIWDFCAHTARISYHDSERVADAVLALPADSRLALSRALCPDTGWQDIQTAPKDGRDVLVYNDLWDYTAGRVQIASFDDGEWNFQSGLVLNGAAEWPPELDDADYQPTHWRPLPDPPAASEQA